MRADQLTGHSAGKASGLAALVLALALAAEAVAQPPQIPAPQAPLSPEQAEAQAQRQARAEQELRELCGRILCYPPGPVHVTLDNGQVGTIDSDYPLPIVDHDIVFVFPGATIYVTGDVEGGKITNLRAVEQPQKLENVFRLHLFQESGQPATFLTITNYFRVPVKYRASMRLPSAQNLLSTSTCPVQAGGVAARESWPHAIFQLALHDFEVLDPTSKVSCD
jgi:hypothetical protein